MSNATVGRRYFKVEFCFGDNQMLHVEFYTFVERGERDEYGVPMEPDYVGMQIESIYIIDEKNRPQPFDWSKQKCGEEEIQDMVYENMDNWEPNA